MQRMLVELQGVVSFFFHTNETFMPTISKELRDLSMPQNDEDLKTMCNEDIVSRYSNLSLDDVLL
jgi:hypothetical protein